MTFVRAIAPLIPIPANAQDFFLIFLSASRHNSTRADASAKAPVTID